MATANGRKGDQAYVQPRAAWSAVLDGKDLADKLAPRLISLRLTEKRGESSDELEIVLHDHDGKLALPKEGARLTIALGWERGTGVTVGLVGKGSFVVDELSWEGPPDKVTIRARSADLQQGYRTRKSRVWNDKTIGQIIDQVAADNGLSPRCHADLRSKVVTAIEQSNKSDMAFVRDLGRRYDAVATVKDKCLIFSPVDADTTATGKAIPSIEITRGKGDSYSYRRAERDRGNDGAEADWYDQGQAKRKTASHGGSRRKKLKRVYASESDAKAASKAEANRIARAAATLQMNLAYGIADLAPGMRASAKGFKTEIDARKWRVASVDHTMDGDGGFRTQLEMEAAA